jgi:NAD(P)-dependent dehydrogenase (short-subunit alcohol dehydrogenase family)
VTAPDQPHPHRRFDELARLDDRVVIVTGGAGFIGRVACAGLAEQGAHVVVVDRDPASCEAVAASLRDLGGAATALAVDLEQEDEVAAVAPRVLEDLGRIDGLVQLAALVSAEPLPGWTTDLAHQGTETWRRALEVNLTAAFVLARDCAPALEASGHGSMVLVGSTYGLVGPDWRIYAGTEMGNAAGYAASKGGTVQLARWLATTLAPGVRVNVLTPGGVERGQPASFVDAYRERTPLGRMAVEEDYKGAIVYLVSDLSRYVTGHNLVVDGGWTAW